MLANISVSVVKSETYGICQHNLLLFQDLVDSIKQDSNRRKMFVSC